MNKYPDIEIGQKHGYITIIDRAEKRGKYFYWLGKCKCGTIKEFADRHVKNGKSSSCGCYCREILSEIRTTHNESKTRTYRIWCHIKDRCTNPKDRAYKNYGGRGITICDDWIYNYQAFKEHIGEIKHPYEIDRIDNNKGYEPGNVRITTTQVNCNNRRNNRYITIGDETKTIAEWSEITGISQGLIRYRLVSGWDIKYLFSAVRAMQHGLIEMGKP